jgi:hypothetical protein
MIIVTWIVLSVAWGVLARELNTGRHNLSRLEAQIFFAVLAVATAAAVRAML